MKKEFDFQDRVTHRVLKSLLEQEPSDCITIVFRSHDKRGVFDRDRIALKNLYREALQHLENREVSSSRAKDILAPLDSIFLHGRSWPSSSSTIVFFLSPTTAHAVALDSIFEPLVFAADRFYVKPLLAELSDIRNFYLLCLSQGSVRLYEGDKEDMTRFTAGKLPESIDEILNEYDFERSLQYNSKTPQARGRRPAIFHGHGEAADESGQTVRLEEFIQRVERAVSDCLADVSRPLILAAVDSVASLYREASEYPNILKETISGNPDEKEKHSLFSSAVKLAEKFYRRERRKLYDSLIRQGSADLSSTALETIVKAASHGAVETLFLSLDELWWGTFEGEDNRVTLHSERKRDSRDLLELAAVETYRNGGRVVVQASDENLLGEKVLAASFRYPIHDSHTAPSSGVSANI